MKCPVCGFSFNDGYVCPHCGVDTYLYKKAIGLSAKLYNKGLSCAKEGDLSGAAAFLEQSITFDKNNIFARNLLGLVYCEIGHIGDALKHWIISTNLQPQNNPASGYMEYMQRNARELEQANDAIRMYNQAIRYLKQGSDDLALIRLKKSIDTNPDFIDSYNLMALCCMEGNNKKRAQQLIEAVLKKDRRNPVALHYAKILQTESSPSLIGAVMGEKEKSIFPKKSIHTQPFSQTTDTPTSSKSVSKRKAPTLPFGSQRDFIIAGTAALFTVIVMLVLVLPAISDAKDQKIQQLEAELESYKGTTNMTADEVVAMRTQLEALQSENASLQSEENKEKNLTALQTALDQLTAEEYETCIATFSTIDPSQFTEEEMQKYNTLKATLYPQVANLYYTRGKSAFLSNEFESAKTDLENALKYVTNENFIDDIYYYLGKIAEENGNQENAISYYQKVVGEYPDSNQLTNTQNALNALQGN